MPRPIDRPELVGATELAARIGVSRMTLNRWIRSGLVPSPSRVGLRSYAWTSRVADRIVRSHGRPEAGSQPSV